MGVLRWAAIRGGERRFLPEVQCLFESLTIDGELVNIQRNEKFGLEQSHACSMQYGTE
jgi:hypothetical protein